MTKSTKKTTEGNAIAPPVPLMPIVQQDPWLAPYEPEIKARYHHYKATRLLIETIAGSLYDFAGAYKYLGLNYDVARKGWIYREWAPEAFNLYFTGDFNNWDRTSHSLQRNESQIWEIFLDDATYKDIFKHGSRYKVVVHGRNGLHDRIPAYANYVVQDPQTHDFCPQVWNPVKPYKFKNKLKNTKVLANPIIYEAHIGMGLEKEGVGTYNEFAEQVLPRIAADGYNVLQIMAVQEHPYYGSYGYHVSNLFAPSSRFGTPDDLKALIDKAHGLGLGVIMDIVHSHAVKNFNEGLSEFDGSDYQYFHSGWRGYHELWDSKLFNYGKWEVQQLLLSNVRYWLEEFNFDGFRFDGVTSMLYLHHGLSKSFNTYADYFGDDVDKDAILYLQLANEVALATKPEVLTIAEDVSGMPGLGSPVEDGGIGFSFRLGMGIPDYWIKLLKEKTDDDWNVWEIWGTLTNRRYTEKTIAYAESHDQALVGDKTIAFWLMDKEMYFAMNKGNDNLIIDRGIAIHKLLRLVTISLGGEGYLNFIGNEFGHPEWIDFPREGNNWSYQYARRQWSLADNGFLKYHYMGDFDKAMVALIREHNILSAPPAHQLYMDEGNKIMIFERGDLIFIFNFHHSNAIFDYAFKPHKDGIYRIVLNSDDSGFGGFDRVDKQLAYPTNEEGLLRLYITNRTALVLQREAVSSKEKPKKAAAAPKKKAE